MDCRSGFSRDRSGLKPLLQVSACAAIAIAFAALASAGNETYAGLPAIAAGDVQVLHNPGFLVGYSALRRQPLWVAYRVESAAGRRLGPRPQGFEPDPRVAIPVTSQDYGSSRYDRGHLAPNFIIGKLYGPEAQRATFLMSNVSPQRKRLNALVWQRLEEAEADDAAPAAGELWVLTGPVFADRPETLKSGIPVPEAFYRIWLDLRETGKRPGTTPSVDEPGLRALAFMVPQQVCGTEPLSRYLATIDEIELRTGLDFFRELDDAAEAALESVIATSGWRLERFDRKPPRYADKFGRLQC